MTNNPSRPLEGLIIGPEASIGDALARIDQAGTGGVALCTPSGCSSGFDPTATSGEASSGVCR